MTAADTHRPDVFARFVDQLAGALDDHELSADERASRLHFSRYHLDRMVRSVAGEPPQALRRRVLLERAAYRMVTTTAPLIDIAVEAGYGSHEAFTRAFARAYGVSPAGRGRGPRPDPHPRAQQRPLPPARQPPAARTRQGDRDGPDDPHGRAPHLADRGDGPARRAADRQAARPADRAR